MNIRIVYPDDEFMGKQTVITVKSITLQIKVNEGDKSPSISCAIMVLNPSTKKLYELSLDSPLSFDKTLSEMKLKTLIKKSSAIKKSSMYIDNPEVVIENFKIVYETNNSHFVSFMNNVSSIEGIL